MWDRIANTVIPNGQELINACRKNKIELIYTVIESLTIDGRDSGLDYKISGLCIAKNSEGAQVIDELKPLENEIIIPKTSSTFEKSKSVNAVSSGPCIFGFTI